MAQTTRRTLMGVLPLTALATAAASLPAIAAAGKVSPIKEAYREFRRLSQFADECREAAYERRKAYVEPGRPLYRMGQTDGRFQRVTMEDGRSNLYLDDSDDNIAELRAVDASAPSEISWLVHTHSRRQDRARTTLAAIDDWKAECRRRKDACGLTEATNKVYAAEKAEEAQARRIHAMPAASLRDLAFKAAVIQIQWDENDVDGLLQNMIELAQIEA